VTVVRMLKLHVTRVKTHQPRRDLKTVKGCGGGSQGDQGDLESGHPLVDTKGDVMKIRKCEMVWNENGKEIAT